ncbi:cation-translocating P-type ATPase [Marinobacter sp.]|uniref:cation-translocating P-type ATPase n=1 Tax=Marinobacter sp. TaxID=50741 RepID=UPI003A8CB8C8
MNRIITSEFIQALPQGAGGLSPDEVIVNRRRFGTNLIIEVPPTGLWALLQDTLKDPMLWFLLATSVIFWLVGERTEAIVLLVALIPFLGMDSYLHRRTQASTAGLSGQLASRALVVRKDGKRLVDAVELVPGDLVEIKAGESFPADGLILVNDSVQVDESALTGEAYPVRKSALMRDPVTLGERAIDGSFWGFAGTRLLSGKAQLRVVFTGPGTLYGEIVQTALSGRQERTPLQQAVSRLVQWLLIIAVAFCGVLAIVRWYQGHGLLDAIISAMTLAVAALPEEFPVVLTFFLGVGVYRLAKRQALVRRAVVVENIGRVTTICSDKTGTLTEGRLCLTHQFPADGIGSERLLTIAANASRSEEGDPLDCAVLQVAPHDSTVKILARFPFTEDRKREVAIVTTGADASVAVKGAPETVLAMCSIDSMEKESWLKQVHSLAVGGHKVIACAWDTWNPGDDPTKEPDRNLRFGGLLAFEDPARKSVKEALQQCRNARIRVIMVTGDHPVTAGALAAEIGLGQAPPRVITGEEMEAKLSQGSGAFLTEVDVVARAVPAQKHTLVRSLQSLGEVVAVTGDGVNDVPALQVADVGIAMGERGTRSAREVAAIVLMDDNFRTIVGAIAEGRQLFANLQMSFQYLLMIHIPLVLTAALIPLLGYPILYLPVHIVWLELIIHPTALLVFQYLPDVSVLQYRRSRKRLTFFNRTQTWGIVLTGTLVTGLIYGSYVRSLGAGRDVEHARAMAIAVLILSGAVVTVALSKLKGTMASVVTGLGLLSAVVMIQVPWLSHLLHMKPLHGDDWLVAAVAATLVFIPVLGCNWNLTRINAT